MSHNWKFNICSFHSMISLPYPPFQVMLLSLWFSLASCLRTLLSICSCADEEENVQSTLETAVKQH